MGMSIKELGEKIKSAVEPALSQGLNPHSKERFFIAFLICLVGTGSFGLGRLSVLPKKNVPLSIGYESQNTAFSAAIASSAETTQEKSQPNSQKIVASKSGTRYYFPACSGGKRIKEENKIWFDSEADAKALGYSLAQNCNQ